MQPRSIHLAFSKYSPEEFMMLLPGWRWGQRWGKGNHYQYGSVGTCKSIGLKFAEKTFVFLLEEPEARDCPKRGESDLQQGGPSQERSRETGLENTNGKKFTLLFFTVYGLLRKEGRKLTSFTSGLVRGDSPVLTESKLTLSLELICTVKSLQGK